MDDDTRTLVAEIDLGDQAERFWNTDLGRFVLQRAQQEIDAALTELKVVSPIDVGKIRELQNDIKVAEAIPLWLNELIVGGRQAMATLQEGE